MSTYTFNPLTPRNDDVIEEVEVLRDGARVGWLGRMRIAPDHWWLLDAVTGGPLVSGRHQLPIFAKHRLASPEMARFLDKVYPTPWSVAKADAERAAREALLRESEAAHERRVRYALHADEIRSVLQEHHTNLQAQGFTERARSIRQLLEKLQ